MRLSVCVPVYNAAPTIDRCIKSILGQSYSDFECVVVDNCSSDDTVQRVSAISDTRIRLVQNRTNLGMVGNHNECVRVARGDLVQFVHADDWLLPDCIATLVPTFDEPNVGFAFARRRVVTSDSEWLARFGRLDGPLQPLDQVNDGRELVRRYLRSGADGNPIGEPTSVMIRRETLVAAGGFRTDVPQLQDIDAWLRMLTRCDAAFVDDELSVRWHHDNSATDEFAGFALLDKLWVLGDLIRCTELGLPLRARALGMWLGALSHSPMSAIGGRRGDRAQTIAGVVRNARYVMTGPPLQFSRGGDA